MHDERQSVIEDELSMLNLVAIAVELRARVPGLHVLRLRCGLRLRELKKDGKYQHERRKYSLFHQNLAQHNCVCRDCRMFVKPGCFAKEVR
jgi:hypothetical protein